ncbi:FAD dependent oxidoreductase domain protein [Synechococcus sp. PCC 7335]|uniref:MSMEG_0569 family flavin-dependent oxidoreductase n=1 Tax=Synechococcus sp. (strain ATCC 29403 / PCC 7335) TaxID=91464 RepID=UPI00017EC434|nr:MSMEG_0569 family flavin-dependent oxidoreductase [Synechococcus sp. PCC 7335]EDX87058.1 FAD dependent oxidoreductase domain protein [Synechococcus sp. PCC 7335]
MSLSTTTHYPVVIVGGGQAGLSVSYCLKQRGIENIIFEKHSVAHSWEAKRWDSFCLVTPNWQCVLPGYAYSGDDPDGFMGKRKIVQYVQDYAQFFEANIREGVAVEKVEEEPSNAVFKVTTSAGIYTADQVVVATGGYHIPKIPTISEALPESVLQLHSSAYKKPADLPAGDVLVVGTGQSGCQIAEDLHLAGRQVHLCVGGAPRSPRQYRGKDVVEWLDQLGYYDITVDEHPQKEAVRKKTNHYVTGRGGGREIDLRQFATEGMRLYGKLKSIEGTRLTLKDDLKKNLDQADEVAESIKRTIDQYIEKNNIEAVVDPPYEPVWQPNDTPTLIDLEAAGINTVIWATGYHMDFSWIEIPAFDGKGYPTHQRGVTTVEGLYFIGLPWLYTWGSGRFSGVAHDAEHLADCIEHCIELRHRGLKLSQPGRYEAINEVAIGS